LLVGLEILREVLQRGKLLENSPGASLMDSIESGGVSPRPYFCLMYRNGGSCLISNLSPALQQRSGVRAVAVQEWLLSGQRAVADLCSSLAPTLAGIA
jgi:hypothetical protein